MLVRERYIFRGSAFFCRFELGDHIITGLVL